ncbi:MAG: hypothetical protein K2N21_06665 [Rikenellaceae bacterium]|nr:hypothetical protein [Rikenellaceae bacterium]
MKKHPFQTIIAANIGKKQYNPDYFVSKRTNKVPLRPITNREIRRTFATDNAA